MPMTSRIVYRLVAATTALSDPAGLVSPTAVRNAAARSRQIESDAVPRPVHQTRLCVRSCGQEHVPELMGDRDSQQRIEAGSVLLQHIARTRPQDITRQVARVPGCAGVIPSASGNWSSRGSHVVSLMVRTSSSGGGSASHTTSTVISL